MKNIRHGGWLVPVLILSVVAFLPALVRRAEAYDVYSDSTAPDGKGNCASCHELPVGGFQSRGALHDAHVNSATGTCLLCHFTKPGDVPHLNSSGEVGGVGCIGCHGQPISGSPIGAGLRKHHALAHVPPDQYGFTCSDCHAATDPTPAPESTLPVYYSRTDVIQKSPCNTDGKEDFWSRTTGLPDGKGLDNDGDLLYDAADPDCGPTCVDQDKDGYGNPGDPSCANGAARDCDDARADVHPGAVEAYDGVDNNCNTEIDEIEGDGFSDPANKQRYSWKDQPPTGQLCDVTRSDSPLFPKNSPNSACLVVATPLAYVDDTAVAPRGSAFYYVVKNTLVADYGKKSDGTLRLYTICP